MFQEKDKKDKIQSPPPLTMARGSVAFQSPRPHGGAIVHDGSSVGAGGLKCFKNFYFYFYYFYFFLFLFQKNFNPPPPLTEPSCTTAPTWGRGDWNAAELSTKFYFILVFCLKHFNPC
jgi:hypothetical protein